MRRPLMRLPRNSALKWAISPIGWPSSVHYELLPDLDAQRIGIELHVEDEATVQTSNILLWKKLPELVDALPEAKVEVLSPWVRKQAASRLRAVFPLGVDAAFASSALATLIERTRTDVSAYLDAGWLPAMNEAGLVPPLERSRPAYLLSVLDYVARGVEDKRTGHKVDDQEAVLELSGPACRTRYRAWVSGCCTREL